jgi:phosphoribosyl 1,2-cyclic phosphate phosphodiesterase
MSSGNSASKLTVIVLGSGTSQGVPMIGCRCPVCLSDDPRDKRTRSSIYLAAPEAKILVDTTPELRVQALREGLDYLDAVLFTHPHADHLMGFDDLRRFCDLRGGPLPIYGSEPTLAQIERTFPTPSIRPKKCGATCMSKGMSSRARLPWAAWKSPRCRCRTEPFRPSASSLPGAGASCSPTSAIAPRCRNRFAPRWRGSRCLIIDGLRDKPHPTHLTVSGAVEAAQAIGAKQSYLTHQTHEKTHADRTGICLPGSRWRSMG